MTQALEELVGPEAEVEKVAGGFRFTEGPVWVRQAGCLLFSDIPANAILAWDREGGATVFRRPVFDGLFSDGQLIGSNGLTLDGGGRLVACEHGNRRVARFESDGRITVLADRFENKRLNSPNDLVYRSNGDLYFTDPPYGLPKREEDPARELSFNGVFRLAADGLLDAVVTDMSRPNGLAFSPDESKLYIGNSDAKRRVWMVHDVKPDGSLTRGEVFFDATQQEAAGSPDGMKVDTLGNLYGTGPGGIWVFTPGARHLGTIQFPELPANCHWGEEDARTMYVTARTGLYRVPMSVAGLRP